MSSPSWRTTLSGIIVILTALLGVAKAATAGNHVDLSSVDWTQTLATVMAGIGLIKARDQAAHHEDAVIADAQAAVLAAQNAHLPTDATPRAQP